MRRIHAVLHRLQPVAVDERVLDDPAFAVFPDKHVPAWQKRRGGGAEISINQSAEILDGISDMLDSIFERAAGRLGGLFEAFTRAIEFPAMIGTPNPLFVDPSVCERRGAMRTMLTDQAVVPFLVAIDDQFLAENFHGANGFFFGQFSCRGHRVPVAAEQLAARRAAVHLSEELVFFARKHDRLRMGFFAYEFFNTSS